jgi:hypothetical protein
VTDSNLNKKQTELPESLVYHRRERESNTSATHSRLLLARYTYLLVIQKKIWKCPFIGFIAQHNKSSIE